LKVALVAHGYPPELTGGTELSVRALARALRRAGHDVFVVAGSIAPSRTAGVVEVDEQIDSDPASGVSFSVRRLRRPDLYFDHWHKTLSPRVSGTFRRILRSERPDVVHIHHWIRLSRDLVLAAAREKIPAVVTLHDLWTSCPIAFRVRTDTQRACEATVAANPCLPCAARVPPRTPWVPRESSHMWLAERQRDLRREIELARARIVPSESHARALERFLELASGSLNATVIAPMRSERLEPVASLAPPRSLGHVELGAWGHLAPHKGQDVLVDALADPRLRARARLHLAGGSADSGFGRALRERARGLDVVFHGPFAAGELARHPVARVHAMVNGSRAHESYGLVLDEARELGIPSVVPRAGAFAERAGKPGSGSATYTPGDSAELASIVASWLDDAAAWPRLRDEARDLARDAVGAGSILEATLAVYERAIAAGAPQVAKEEWFESRMRDSALDEWDKSLSSRTAAELGIESP
jgi:glycosyltransferase involved in cell wall biosynthesis